MAEALYSTKDLADKKLLENWHKHRQDTQGAVVLGSAPPPASSPSPTEPMNPEVDIAQLYYSLVPSGTNSPEKVQWVVDSLVKLKFVEVVPKGPGVKYKLTHAGQQEAKQLRLAASK